MSDLSKNMTAPASPVSVILPPAVGFLVGLVPCLLLPGARLQLLPLLGLPFIVFAWAGVGGTLCKLLRVEAGLPVRAGLGAASCNTLIFLGGLAGLYHSTILVWFPLVFVPVGVMQLRADLRRAEVVPPVVHLLRACQGAAAALLLLVIAVPAMDPDAMTYHLALPELWAVRGRFVHVPTLHYSFLPLAAEQGFLMARLWFAGSPVHGWTLAQGMGLLHGLLLARAVTTLVPRNDRAGHLARETAALVVFMLPVTLLVSGLPYNDAYGAALVVLALGQCLRWAERPSAGRAALSGLLVGFALGAKTTLLVAPPILLVAVWLASRPRPDPPSWIRGLSIAGAAAALVWLPWVVSTFLATGNPVYPFAFDLLDGAPQGAPAWDAAAVSRNLADAGLGAGWNPWRWITAPLELWTRPLGFGLLPRVGPNLLFAIPFLAWTFRRGAGRRERALAVATLLFYVFWSVTSRNARFLLPALALALTVTALALARFAVAGGSRRLAAFGLIAGLIAWDATAATSVFSVLLKPAAYLSGAESREEYLAARRRPSETFRWASRSLDDDARVLLVGETRSLGLERDRLVGGALDPSPLLWLERKTRAGDFVEAVRRSEMTHLMFDPASSRHLAMRRDRYRGREADLAALQVWLEREATLVFSRNGVLLYEIPR
jgi:hypothetical protein